MDKAAKQQKQIDNIEEKYGKQKEEIRKLRTEQKAMGEKWQKMESAMKENNTMLQAKNRDLEAEVEILKEQIKEMSKGMKRKRGDDDNGQNRQKKKRRSRAVRDTLKELKDGEKSTEGA